MKKFCLYLFEKWLQLPEAMRFVLVGGWNTLFSYALYVLILWFMDSLYPQTALFISFVLSTFQSYITQKIFVFHTKGNYIKEYSKCLGAWCINYFLNAFLLSVFLHVKVNPYIGQLWATIIITISNYMMLKYIAFKKH